MTQDIINALGRFSALTVMSWNAVFPYKGKPASPEEIGRGLAVSYLVEGSVRQTADRVRVIAQLVDTRQGRVIWSARFEEALADVFALQDNIVTRIVRALAIRVTQIEQNRVFAKPTENLAAYDYVLRARPALQSPTHANNVEARALLRRAIELDPNYAAAYAALAETYHLASSMGWAESPTAFLSRAEELAIKALTLMIPTCARASLSATSTSFVRDTTRQRLRSSAPLRSIRTMLTASPGAAPSCCGWDRRMRRSRPWSRRSVSTPISMRSIALR
ncbi:hypothetical protein AJ87_45690 [Rhizobium yanglingense]|nr:hypothetical protein AJ87_45690 [Rhizobium yanglingense]